MTPIAAPTSRPALASRPLLSRAAWGWLALLALLFVALHSHIIWWMLRIIFDAKGDPGPANLLHAVFRFELNQDWSHALVIPLISIYFIAQNRDRLRALSPRVYWPGLLALYAGVTAYVLAIYPVRNDMLQGYAMILSLLGLVLFLLGPAFLRVLWFPILYLALAIKVSDSLWDRLAVILRQLAAQGATFLLNILQPLMGVSAELRGTTIELFDKGVRLDPPMDVADACSGLRMLMAFIAFGLAMAYLFPRHWWQRLLMVLLTIPIAVVVNVGRILVLAMVRTKINPELATGDFHIFFGMLMLLPAAGLFWLLGWVLDKIVIYESPPLSPRERVAASSPPTPSLPPNPSADPSTSAPPPPASNQKSEIANQKSLRPLLEGSFLGAALTLLLGLDLALVATVIRPDFLATQVSAAIPLLLLLLASAATAAALWRLVREARGSAGSLLVRPLALAFAAGVLLSATLGLNGALRTLKVVLAKQPVELRRSLLTIPARLGSWEAQATDRRLPEDQEKELGTKAYLLRRYVDLQGSRPPGAALGAVFAGGVVHLQVAYYTGTVDTVPHIPDRCYPAAGKQPIGGRTTLDLTLAGPAFAPAGAGFAAFSQDRTPVRLPALRFAASSLSFHEPGRPDQPSTVIYFFIANGQYLATAEQVRTQSFNIRDRYAYYAKIELLLEGVGDKARAAKSASAFLNAALPDILACLPDWQMVLDGRWPPSLAAPTPALPIADH